MLKKVNTLLIYSLSFKIHKLDCKLKDFLYSVLYIIGIRELWWKHDKYIS